MKLLYIADRQTDLSEVLSLCPDTSVTLRSAADFSGNDARDYDAFVFDGGAGGGVFTQDNRPVADSLVMSGKKVFAVFCRAICTVAMAGPDSTRYQRPVRTKDGCLGIESGTILDEQCNERYKPYIMSSDAVTLLSYVECPEGFYRTEKLPDGQMGNRALFLENDTTLICTFKLCDFAKARFSPKREWFRLIDYVCEFLTGAVPERESVERLYEKNAYSVKESGFSREEIAESVGKALKWHETSGVIDTSRGLKNALCVEEGLSSEVYADGKQNVNVHYTTCSNGETGLLYRLAYLYTGNEDYRSLSDNLLANTLKMIAPYENAFKGYTRSWTDNGWMVSYQDGATRGVALPILFRMLFENDFSEKQKLTDMLDFFVSTTGRNGLRVCRTDITDIKNEKITALTVQRDENGKWKWGSLPEMHVSELRELDGVPSAHYNAYYLASLLLAYKLLGKQSYLDTALKGLTTIMEDYYPDTAREHSETQELCRLILPLSYLYWVTKQEKHLAYLKRVCSDLEKKRVGRGAFCEWDTGYKAACAKGKNSEASVLSDNGDPVTDMLYSMNWLPFSLIQAYYITDDAYFFSLWNEVAGFLASIQIRSENGRIDGAWPRAFDVKGREVYGVPNDVGWSPWSVECGWTMGQIPSGLLLGLLEDKIRDKYTV